MIALRRSDYDYVTHLLLSKCYSRICFLLENGISKEKRSHSPFNCGIETKNNQINAQYYNTMMIYADEYVPLVVAATHNPLAMPSHDT